LSQAIGLDVTVVVLASPDESTVGFHHVGDHIIDESVFVDEFLLIELSLVVLIEDLLEDVLEATVILLQDGVLGRQIAWIVTFQSVLEGRMSELSDALVGVEHTETDTAAWVVEDLVLSGCATVLWCDDDLELRFLGTTKSVHLYWSPKPCLPIMIGSVQPGTRRGMFLQMIGSRKMVPSR